MRMQSVSRIDVLLIESGEPPTGVGEVSVPTAAPGSQVTLRSEPFTVSRNGLHHGCLF